MNVSIILVLISVGLAGFAMGCSVINAMNRKIKKLEKEDEELKRIENIMLGIPDSDEEIAKLKQLVSKQSNRIIELERMVKGE